MKDLLDGINAAWDGYQQATALRAAVAKAAPAGAAPDVASAAASLRAVLDSVIGPEGGRSGPGGGAPTFQSVSAAMAGQLTLQDHADHAPTAPMLAAYGAGCRDLGRLQATLSRAGGSALSALNAALGRHGIPEVASDTRAVSACRPVSPLRAP